MSDAATQPVRDALRGNFSPGKTTPPRESLARPSRVNAPIRRSVPANKKPPRQSAKATNSTNTPDSVLPEDIKLEQSRVAPGMYKPVPEITVFSWQSPSRPFKKRDRQFFVTISVIALLVSLILFFSGQFLPIAVVVSVVFLLYVLQVIPPHDVKHEITTFGIKVEGTTYYWEELGRFWFDTKHDELTLSVEVARFPGRITVVLPKEHREEVSAVLSEVLLEQKPEPTFYERVAQWFQERIPLE